LVELLLVEELLVEELLVFALFCVLAEDWLVLFEVDDCEQF
jgi:hypothetical protein